MMHRGSYARARLAVSLLLLLFLAQPGHSRSAGLKGLDARIEEMMSDWFIPGAAVAVVKDDEVILCRGFGVRDLGTSEPVTEETIFAIGSSTKAFTAAALAILVDQEKLGWDDPVTDYLPWFKLHDVYATREMRVRDLLAHNSGLVGGDRVWYGTGLSREEVVRRSRHLAPEFSFRSTFHYNNTMFIAAGLIVESISGQSWDDFVVERLLTPLAMTSSGTSVSDLAAEPDVATPHTVSEGVAHTIPWRNIDNVGPAGSINSSVEDMLGWVRLQLGEGQVDGRRIISADSVQQMHTPQTVMQKKGFFGYLYDESNLMSYAMGWLLADYQGYLTVTHGGNIDGNTALVALVPSEELGIVILTNMEKVNGFNAALSYEIFDRLLGTTSKDWNAYLLGVWDQMKSRARKEAKRVIEARIRDTSPSLPLPAYVGTYDHPMYPSIVVSLQNKSLLVNFADTFEAPLDHWHFDTFRAAWDTDSPYDVAPDLVRFALDNNGEPTLLYADFDGQIPFGRREGQ